MGERGPVGKRDEERRRRNKTEVATTTVDITALIQHDVEIPVAPEDWHKTARFLFDSFSRSGQARFYEPTDWATIYLTCEQIHYDLLPRKVQIGTAAAGDPIFQTMVVPMPGAKLGAYLKALSSLLATEGDRRRLSIELERQNAANPEGEGASVSNIGQRRQGRLA